MNCFIVPPPTGCWARIAADEADRDGPLPNGRQAAILMVQHRSDD